MGNFSSFTAVFLIFFCRDNIYHRVMKMCKWWSLIKLEIYLHNALYINYIQYICISQTLNAPFIWVTWKKMLDFWTLFEKTALKRKFIDSRVQNCFIKVVNCFEKQNRIVNELVTNMTKFLFELGTGFAFMGNQYHLCVDNDDYYILTYFSTI